MSPQSLDGIGLTFGRFLDLAAERFGRRDAVAAFDRSYDTPRVVRRTYHELAEDVHALQAALQSLGVQPGDRVAVLLSSFVEWILHVFAVTRLGATFVPLNPRFGTHELAHILSHSGSSTLVAMGRYLGHDYAARIEEVTGGFSRANGSPRLPALRRIVGVRTMPHPEAIDTDALLAHGRELVARDGVPPPAIDVESTAILFYTSGTTAFPKGVPLTHRNLLPHTVGCGALLELAPDDRVLTLYPFFGISGGANKVLSTLAFGACLVFQDAFRADEALDVLLGESCTVVHGVDVQVRELLRIARDRGIPHTDRRGTIAFMAALDRDLAREMGEVLGLRRFVHPYGMTETNPMILRNDPDDPFEAQVRPGGRVTPFARVRIVDPDTGMETPDDVPGEIEVSGETVMKGYYRDPEATAKAFRDGWFRTGDQGVRTADGWLFYVGRLKDMLKIGGFNVAPQEVEAFLRTHPAIEDVAVTGLPDARLGEVPVAFVKARPGATIDQGELAGFCRGHIANFKIPQRVAVIDALPFATAAHGAKLRRDVLRTWARERWSETSTSATLPEREKR